MPENKNTLPPVQIHFSVNFPVETRCSTSEEEPAIVEITKVEYSFGEKDLTKKSQLCEAFRKVSIPSRSSIYDH